MSRGKNNLHHFVYLTTNNINGKLYIGKHSTNDLDDGYIGSGIDKTHNKGKAKRGLVGAVHKHGYENFSSEIWFNCKTEKETYRLEYAITRLFNVVEDDQFYNLEYGGEGNCSGEESFHFGRKRPDSTREKISKAKKGMSLSEEHCKNLSISHMGYVPSDEHRANWRLAWENKEGKICPWCNTLSKGGIMDYFHFDNCRSNPNYVPAVIICPHCGKKGKGKSNMDRYHFDNCMKNPDLDPSRIIKCTYCEKIGIEMSKMNQFHNENCSHKPK